MRIRNQRSKLFQEPGISDRLTNSPSSISKSKKIQVNSRLENFDYSDRPKNTSIFKNLSLKKSVLLSTF